MRQVNRNLEGWLDPKHNSREDEQRRNTVFLQGPPDVVLLMINSSAELGLETIVKTDESELDARHARLAALLGVDAGAYRPQASSGKWLIQQQHGIRLKEFVAQLEEAGYRYAYGHRYQKDGIKDPTNVLAFSRTGDAVAMPAAVRTLIDEAAFAGLNVWANEQADKRLDTVNCYELKGMKKPGRRLVRFGKTGASYRVVE